MHRRVHGIAFFLLACTASGVQQPPPNPPPARHTLPEGAVVRFRGQRVFAGRSHALVEIPGVSKDDLAWAPDGDHFAFARAPGATQSFHIYVKNTAGDPMNEFEVYRAGAPRELEWIDDRRVAYLAASQKNEAAQVYVIHDTETGEIVTVRRGRHFSWSPGKKRLAYVTGGPARESVRVDGRPVWPRASVATRIHGEISWSPDGHGLAFVEAPKKRPSRLVVMVELDDAGGDLTWPLPEEALAPGLHLFWAGASKVVIGETHLKPKFAANWERLQ